MTEHVSPKDKAYIIRTIQSLLPQAKIIAFGSRVAGKPKKYSDLDLALKNPTPISFETLSKLSEYFSESDLPYKVDIVDFGRIEEDFKKIVLSSGREWAKGAA